VLLNNVILPQPANQHCKATTEIAKTVQSNYKYYI